MTTLTKEQKTIRRFVQAGCNAIKWCDTTKPISREELRFYTEAVKGMRDYPSIFLGFPSVEDVENKWLKIRKTLLGNPETYPMAYQVLNPMNEMLYDESDED